MLKAVKQVVLASALMLFGTFASYLQAGDSLQRVVDFQVLTVGMSGNQPPMTMLNREGALMGFDVDLAQAMAAAMNVTLDITRLPFGELMAALEEDKVDMVISNLSITPQRTELVSFVGPYMMSGKSLLTKDSVLARAESTVDFNRADLKLVALKNSTSSDFAREAAPDAKLIEVADYDEGVAQVIRGDADALVADMPICLLSVLRYPEAGLTTLGRPITVEPIGIAIKSNAAQFLNLVQNYVDAYAKSGMLSKLRKKWLEEKDWIAALP